ncbi:methyltransferase domain-containing protein [Caenimonas aquaedulcis]|uniref:Class I SAM-dependent methyltransferase n=1 Tax=Caenimonas aquaedulcis TaxID=2793270 RepID=A0A931H458_9BURK|nr:class I SAM-dependent methyltransferase [Caenimonas aquaedulcis]MBG9388177.1 class I SAM-dependent methyltransferase [Caenimonas aquaedulcis]
MIKTNPLAADPMASKYWDPVTASLTESKNTYADKMASGFFKTYLGGDVVLDIGFRGGRADAVPILRNAIGIELDYPGYDGRRLPFDANSVDTVYSSHCLEHIADYAGALMDWMRVLKIGGFIVVVVPHMYLYERKTHPPSQWNRDHKRFYSPARLLREFEESLPLSTFRVCHLRENWNPNFNYQSDLTKHASGPYEIEAVVKKIE